MKTTSSEPQGRREFLKRAAVTGGAVTVLWCRCYLNLDLNLNL